VRTEERRLCCGGDVVRGVVAKSDAEVQGCPLAVVLCRGLGVMPWPRRLLALLPRQRWWAWRKGRARQGGEGLWRWPREMGEECRPSGAFIALRARVYECAEATGDGDRRLRATGRVARIHALGRWRGKKLLEGSRGVTVWVGVQSRRSSTICGAALALACRKARAVPAVWTAPRCVRVVTAGPWLRSRGSHGFVQQRQREEHPRQVASPIAVSSCAVGKAEARAGKGRRKRRRRYG
jgi:hypothetical protein